MSEIQKNAFSFIRYLFIPLYYNRKYTGYPLVIHISCLLIFFLKKSYFCWSFFLRFSKKSIKNSKIKREKPKAR